MSAGLISKKKKVVADGLFYAELNEFFIRQLGEEGYAGVEVRVTPMKTEIIIRATQTQAVLGEKNRRIRELTAMIKRRFSFPDGNVELYVERVRNRALSAMAQAESVRFKLAGGLALRRACYGVIKYIMMNGAKGCEIIVSGKIRAQRAQVMKFKDGYMIKSGDCGAQLVDSATRHLNLKQGVLGIKVSIMLPYDAAGLDGSSYKTPDIITINPPKDVEVSLTGPLKGFAENFTKGGQQQQQETVQA